MLRAAALGLLLVAGCQPQVMDLGERNSRLHKLFGLPCDTTMCGALWRYDDPERGVTCYITSGKHDLISCVRMGDLPKPDR